MALPARIEIVPVKQRVSASIVVPGSKSVTNRALVLGALARGKTVIRGALWSEDTRVMVRGLKTLGFAIQVAPESGERANRTIEVRGGRGRIPDSGASDSPVELFVGNAGTAARFLAALVCLGKRRYRLVGVERMHQRPQEGLFRALRSLGYRVEAAGDRLPAVIHGMGPRTGSCRVSVEQSSQFASALLLVAPAAGWKVEVTGANPETAPYVVMTRKLIEAFKAAQGVFQVEPDASSGSYFWAADALINAGETPSISDPPDRPRIRVENWPDSDWQIDARFPRVLPLNGVLSRAADLGDSIMTAIVMAPFAERPVRFTHLGRLRVQECERVQALRTELCRCGARVQEEGDSLMVFPSRLHGAQIETYGDHRMAMCFSVLGLKVARIHIRHPACVAKTFPNFFQKLAAPPPHGLGAEIRDGGSGRSLPVDALAMEEVSLAP